MPTPRAVLRLVLSAATAAALVVSAHLALADSGDGAAASGPARDFSVRTALSTHPTHVDPLPDGVSLDDPVNTAALYARAGQDRAELVAETREAETADATTPPGRPSTAGLGAHVTPSCSGTGSDGKRVQPMYVREASTPSRYSAMLPLLLNEVANVDDVFAVSAAKTNGVRRVRWVHQGCQPVLPEVVVPDGALSSFDATIDALAALGLTDPNRKYLAFAEKNALCGVGTLWLDTRPAGNLNDTRTGYARVDAPCWSGGTSVAAHELTHNLGGVLPGAPHRTANGHCWDETDLMCYNDGSGTAMQTLCADARNDQLLDCGDDDYFSTAPPAGNWLASNWNTASSSFLDSTVVNGSTALPPPVAPSTDPVPSAPTKRGTKLKARWHDRHGQVTGQLRRADHTRVAGAVLTLQRRYRGDGWEVIGQETTDRAGRVAERDRPRRTAYYRWVFGGSDQLAASRSAKLRAVR